jgi:hypothetical protein
MANELKEKIRSDGFAGYVRTVAGKEDRSGVNDIVKYNEPKWLHNGVELPPGDEYIVRGIGRYLLKWPPASDKGQAPYRETIPDGEPFPDVDKLNAEEPHENWTTDPNGNPKGPWATERQVDLLNRTLDKLTYVTSTTGGGICVDQLVDKVNSLREFYGNNNICAVVKLSNIFMPTRYGGQQRPHFEYQRAVTYGDGGEVKTIEPPSAKGVTNDEIKY